MRHNENEQLLRYVDGELPAGAAGKVRSHLEACWQCRAEREQLENTVSRCVSYRKDILQRYLPSPPAPWIDIYRGFAAIDASSEPGFFDRVRQFWEWPVHNVKKLAVATVALLVIWGLFYRFRQTPSVQAAELLRKAVAAADAQPVKPHHIQIRTRQHSITRLAGAPAKPIATPADRDALNSLQALFLAANYDWDDPLSARSYQAWRKQLVDKHDEVTPEQDTYRVRTDTSSGELSAATLKLRMRDLHPVEERFEFRNQEWVEITELAEEPAPQPNGVAASGERPAGVLTAAPEGTSSNAAPLAAPAGSATVGDELHVFAALHQVGADLGDPIEISRTGGKVLVSGVGIPPQRQQEIHGVLGSTPHVVVRFSESAPATVQPQKETPTESTISADVRQLQGRIAQQIGGRAYFDQLAAQVLDLSESMMSRAYALRRLADRFPGAVEAELGAEDLQLLRKLQQEHTAALRQQASEIDRVLRPVLVAVSASTRKDPRTEPGVGSFDAWQPATEDLFQSARQVEKLLAGMFGAAPLDSGEEQLPSQLLTSLGQLQAKLDVYNGFVRKPLERRDR